MQHPYMTSGRQNIIFSDPPSSCHCPLFFFVFCLHFMTPAPLTADVIFARTQRERKTVSCASYWKRGHGGGVASHKYLENNEVWSSFLPSFLLFLLDPSLSYAWQRRRRSCNCVVGRRGRRRRSRRHTLPFNLGTIQRVSKIALWRARFIEHHRQESE